MSAKWLNDDCDEALAVNATVDPVGNCHKLPLIEDKDWFPFDSAIVPVPEPATVALRVWYPDSPVFPWSVVL